MKRSEQSLIKLLCVWATIGAVLTYAGLIEPFWIEIHHVSVQDAHLNRVLKGMTAVHLTDLHIGALGKRERRVLDLVAEIKPNFIFLTGDYVKWNGDYEPALEFLSQLRAKAGIWAVMGDYDYSNDRKSCLFCHQPASGRRSKRHRVHFLRDSMETVKFQGETLKIAGFETLESGRLFNESERLALAGDLPTIVLYHSPLLFDSMDNRLDLLALAGDTHGGQLPVPAWAWKLFGYEKDAQCEQGLFKEGRKQMVVSRGIGTSHVPLRLFRRGILRSWVRP